jgi:hypothetical protein
MGGSAATDLTEHGTDRRADRAFVTYVRQELSAPATEIAAMHTLSPVRVKTRDYRCATLMAGSPRSADITSTVDGKALGAEGRLV